MSKCPVLNELEMREDYDPEHEQTPHLSGGDYDISAIRACGENCMMGAIAYQRLLHLERIARLLGLPITDTAKIDAALQELIRSRDEWCTEAAKNAGRIEEMVGENARLREACEAALPWIVSQIEYTGCEVKDPCELIANGLRAALDVQP